MGVNSLPKIAGKHWCSRPMGPVGRVPSNFRERGDQVFKVPSNFCDWFLPRDAMHPRY